MTRGHPVYPWMFEWAADLMTRHARVGDLGNTAVQLIRGSKSSRNIAQFGEKILYKPLKLSGHHRGNMEDTFLDGIFLGMRLRSDEILIGTARGVIKTRTLRRRVEEEPWDSELARSIQGEPRQPVPGINSDHVPAAISDRAGVHLEEDQADARLAQQDEFIDPPEAREVSMPPGRLVSQVRSDTLKRMYVTRGLGKKYGPTPGCPGCAKSGSHHQASHSNTCSDRMRTELEKSEEGREYLAREQARVDARKKRATLFIKPQTCCVRGMGCKEILVLESSDGRMFIGDWEHTTSLKRTTSIWKTKVAGDEYLGLDESMDITTVNEQGVQWDFTYVEMRNQAFKQTVAEKPFLLTGAHSCANWRSRSNTSWSRMTERDRLRAPQSPSTHAVCLSQCTSMQHEEGRYFLHEDCQSELPWRKDCVEEIQEMTGAKFVSVSRGDCNPPSNEKPTVMATSCPSIAFTLRVSSKARLLHKRYPEHLERNQHKSIEDLHEDISCGMQLQHKWSRRHKYLVASEDVKNPQANFNDLDNSVPIKRLFAQSSMG